MHKMTVTKKVTVKVPKGFGAKEKKAKPASPHFRMRHLSPMGHSTFGTPPGQSGGPAFPNSVPPDAGGPPAAFGAPPGDMGPGGGAPPVPGM